MLTRTAVDALEQRLVVVYVAGELSSFAVYTHHLVSLRGSLSFLAWSNGWLENGKQLTYCHLKTVQISVSASTYKGLGGDVTCRTSVTGLSSGSPS